MSNQEIIGEINMNHGQKGGSDTGKGAIIGLSVAAAMWLIYKLSQLGIPNQKDKIKCMIRENMELQIQKDLQNDTDLEPFLNSVHGVIITFFIKNMIERKEPKINFIQRKRMSKEDQNKKIKDMKTKQNAKYLKEITQAILRSLRKELKATDSQQVAEATTAPKWWRFAQQAATKSESVATKVKKPGKKCISEHVWEENIKKVLGEDGIVTKIKEGEKLNKDECQKIIEKFQIDKLIKKIIEKIRNKFEALRGEDALLKMMINKFSNNTDERKKMLDTYKKDTNTETDTETGVSSETININYNDLCDIGMKKTSKLAKMNPIYWTGNLIHNRMNYNISDMNKTIGINSSKALREVKLYPCYNIMSALLKDMLEPLIKKFNTLTYGIDKKDNMFGKHYEKISNFTTPEKKLFVFPDNFYKPKINGKKCCITVDKLNSKEKDEPKKAETKKAKSKIVGGELIGQGTFGCVFKPHLLCKSNKSKKIDDDYVSKLIVLRPGEYYRLVQEVNIGKIILSSKKYSTYFSPILSICPIKYNDIDDKDIKQCNSTNKYPENKMMLAKLKKVNGVNFIDTLKNLHKTICLTKFFTIYNDLLIGLNFLSEKKIIHYDIKWDNVLYDENIKRCVIIDFGLAFEIDKIDFTSEENLKNYFYGYWGTHPVWCFDIQYICFLLHRNLDISIFIDEYISNNFLFKKMNISKEILYDWCLKTVKSFENLHSNILKRIELITKKYYTTWDNFSLSIMYLKNYNLVLKNKPQKYPSFHKKFIKQILLKNIHPNPKKRLSLKKSNDIFNKLKSNMKASEWQKLSSYC